MPKISNIEIWKDIPGFEGSYQVSNKGRVKSCFRIVIREPGIKQPIAERILKFNTNGENYLCVSLRKNKQTITCLVHRLVLEAFVGPCPVGMECRHYPNPRKSDNNLENLQWGTPKENGQDQIRFGLSAHSEETKEKIRLALTGKKHTEERRAALREGHKNGKSPISPESNKKRSESLLGRSKICSVCGKPGHNKSTCDER